VRAGTPNPSAGAPLWRRLAALLYDALLLLALLFLATAAAMAVHAGRLDPQSLGFRIYLGMVVALFYAWFWSHGGQTLGMRAWRLRLETRSGGPVGWNRALARFVVAWLVPVAGLLWVAFDPGRHALHDRLTRTRVVLLPPAGT